MRYNVEYYPNESEGEQAQEISESEFMELLQMHANAKRNPCIWADDEQLTIQDVWGIYYG